MTTTIIMPDEIDQNFLVSMLTELEAHEGDEHIRLFCSSNGGYSRPTLAIMDLLKQYPIVDGYLLGAAISSAGIIWAACAKRYVYPNAYLGIHGVNWRTGQQVANARELRAKADEFEAIDRAACRIFAAASNKDFDWWYQKLISAPGLLVMQAEELIALDMGEMVKL